MIVSFEVAGDKQIQREILRVGAYASDATPAFVALGELLIDETGLQFASEGKHASAGWKPLKAATVKEKQRKGLRMQILQATGSLVDSLTKKDDANMIFEATPEGLDFGSRVGYSGYHQTGTRPGAGRGHNLPKRPPLELTEATRVAAVKLVQRFILTGELV